MHSIIIILRICTINDEKQNYPFGSKSLIVENIDTISWNQEINVWLNHPKFLAFVTNTLALCDIVIPD